MSVDLNPQLDSGEALMERAALKILVGSDALAIVDIDAAEAKGFSRNLCEVRKREYQLLISEEQIANLIELLNHIPQSDRAARLDAIALLKASRVVDPANLWVGSYDVTEDATVFPEVWNDLRDEIPVALDLLWRDIHRAEKSDDIPRIVESYLRLKKYEESLGNTLLDEILKWQDGDGSVQNLHLAGHNGWDYYFLARSDEERSYLVETMNARMGGALSDADKTSMQLLLFALNWDVDAELRFQQQGRWLRDLSARNHANFDADELKNRKQNLPVQSPSTTDPQSASTPALPEVSIRQLLDEWVNSFKAKDADSHSNCYAPMIEQYFLRSNVTHDHLRRYKEAAFQDISEVRQYDIRDVAIAPETAGRYAATFHKSWDTMGRDGKQFSGEEIQKLQFAIFNGEWKIVSEVEVKIIHVVKGDIRR